MPLFRNIHHNPEFFSGPQNFDPSRFEVGTAFHRKRVDLFEAERMISAASFGVNFCIFRFLILCFSGFG
jgi:cytochrome P450